VFGAPLPPVPESADAVVIGAGAFGFATAYQLAKAGLKEVVLLDQFEPGTQVSARAAGLFKLVQASEVKTQLAQRAVAVVTGFAAETGIVMPYVASGSMYAARTPAHASMVEAEVEDSLGWGVRLERLDKSEIRLATNYLNGDNIVSAWFVPEDIYIEEPRSMLMAYRQAGVNLGMLTIGHTPATGIRIERGAIAAVETPRGLVRTPIVVDTAGAWARAVGVMAMVDVPILPLRHQLRITSPIAGIAATDPVVRLIDSATYIRPSRGGLMFGGMESTPVPVDPTEAPGFSMDHLPLDHGLNDQFVDALVDDIPALRDAGIQEERGGVFTMTADGRLLVGPAAGVRGFWMATGCNGTGFSLSSGVGYHLAEWITTGAPSIDLSPLDPNRFTANPVSDADLRMAAVWQYANYYVPR
jgi:glycine/D-amino acid oxidase-like deaminating enzyme